MNQSDLPAVTPDVDLRDAIQAVRSVFELAGLEEAETDARVLVLAAAGVDRVTYLCNPNMRLGAAAQLLLEWSKRRLRREPVSRILGVREFWGLSIHITPDVLAPRPESELMIELGVAHLGARRSDALRFLDLGLGSGALLCALLMEFPNATGCGLELSAAACRVAERNLERLGLGGRAQVLNSGWGRDLKGNYDLVVSNPPYIASGCIGGLDPEVRLYDPTLALDGGDDGLARYREIGPLLPRLLSEEGAAILEIGYGQSEGVVSVLERAGMEISRIAKDLAGIDRAILCRKGPRLRAGGGAARDF